MHLICFLVAFKVSYAILTLAVDYKHIILHCCFSSDVRLLPERCSEEVCGDSVHSAARHLSAPLHHKDRRRLFLHLRLALHTRRLSG